MLSMNFSETPEKMFGHLDPVRLWLDAEHQPMKALSA
jgi:hypothetical protein